jgi:hemolysin III
LSNILQLDRKIYGGVMSDSSKSDVASTQVVKPLLRGWLHLVGFFVLLACSPILIARAHTWAQVIWVLCYVVGVASMMLTSALFHRVNWSPSKRRAWKRADHSTIFLAITGSYLAIAGLTMHGDIRLVLMIIIASGAAIGIAIRQLALDTPKWVNTLPYLVVGWAAVVVMPQIYRGGGPLCFSLVVAGGLAYSLGAFFYGAKRPKLSPRVFGYHELFHAFTLVGAGLHFWAIAVALR